MRPGEKNAEQMNAEEHARQMARPIRISCAFCNWNFEGTVGEGKEAALEHRQREHPHAKQRTGRRKRSGAMLNIIKQPTLSEEELDEIETERRRRAIELGVEISEPA